MQILPVSCKAWLRLRSCSVSTTVHLVKLGPPTATSSALLQRHLLLPPLPPPLYRHHDHDHDHHHYHLHQNDYAPVSFATRALAHSHIHPPAHPQPDNPCVPTLRRTTRMRVCPVTTTQPTLTEEGFRLTRGRLRGSTDSSSTGGGQTTSLAGVRKRWATRSRFCGFDTRTSRCTQSVK
jgi:hypothetical protein